MADWWRGTRNADGDLVLSSYELLIYLEFMDDEGAFKTAAERGGRWSTPKQMLAEAVNEAYRLRASFHAANGGEKASFDPTPFEFIDPVVRAEREREAKAKAAAAEARQSRFESEMGFT